MKSGRGETFEVLQVGIRADDDQAIARMKKGFRRRIEDEAALGGLNAQNHGPALFVKQ